MSSQPSPPSPLATAEPWDLVANDYSAELLPMFEHFSKLALQLVRVPAGGYVLDVATGPGTLALLAAAQGSLQAPSLKEFWESCQRTTAPIVLLRRKLGEEHWQQVAAGVE